MYLLQIDLMHNRLYLRLTGTFDEAQSEKLAAELMVRRDELADGFHVLCDLTGLDTFNRPARKHYRNFMDLCRKCGVRKVIRIVPESQDDFGLNIMSHFHYRNIPVINCNNLADALTHLKTSATQKLQNEMSQAE